MPYAAHPSIPADRDVLVCVFQRGAADAPNSLAPYGDDDYALHPAPAPLAPIHAAGDLLLAQAVGVPHGSRSHFTAQNLFECIETFYNRRRRHSYLGYISPVEFERRYAPQ